MSGGRAHVFVVLIGVSGAMLLATLAIERRPLRSSVLADAPVGDAAGV